MAKADGKARSQRAAPKARVSTANTAALGSALREEAERRRSTAAFRLGNLAKDADDFRGRVDLAARLVFAMADGKRESFTFAPAGMQQISRGVEQLRIIIRDAQVHEAPAARIQLEREIAAASDVGLQTMIAQLQG